MNLSYEQLALAAAQMRTATEQVDAELTRVKALVEKFIQNGYVTDVASRRFADSYALAMAEASQLSEGLNGLAEYLQATVQAYQEVNSAARTDFNA
jgi:uncharacterized protein YukE